MQRVKEFGFIENVLRVIIVVSIEIFYQFYLCCCRSFAFMTFESNWKLPQIKKCTFNYSNLIVIVAIVAIVVVTLVEVKVG
jgi:hypothetical protein